jgi:ABC-type sugar transport system ATPase subunit
MVTDERQTLLSCKKISKAYGTTRALSEVNFDVRRGEIHALLGENGAGKSTLVKIISGALRPDDGDLRLDGRDLTLHSSQDGLAQGIAVVHQELSVLPNLSVDENVCLGNPPLRRTPALRAFGMIDRKEMRRRTTAAAELLGYSLPNERVAYLSPAQRQLVEIVRALARSARVLLLDEPTSSLPPGERWRLFERLDHLRGEGIGVVFITHLLDEALEISDRITVLRDGRNAGTQQASETTISNLIELMTGRPAGTVYPNVDGAKSEAVARLSVEAIASYPEVQDISLSVGPGEIVGLAGLVGSGRTECLRTLFGLRHLDAGRIRLDGQIVRISSPRIAIARGIAFIPEDRQAEGLFHDDTVARNIAIAAVNTSRGETVTSMRGRLLSLPKITEVARRLTEALRIKVNSIHDAVSALSGGNQQKVVLARWLATRPSMVLADEPTRGVAISSKIEIYRLLRELADGGAAVLFVSSEFEELIGLCDRVILIRAGKSTGETVTTGLDSDSLLNLLFATRELASSEVIERLPAGEETQ